MIFNVKLSHDEIKYLTTALNAVRGPHPMAARMHDKFKSILAFADSQEGSQFVSMDKGTGQII